MNQQKQQHPVEKLVEESRPTSELIRNLLGAGKAEEAVALSVSELERSKMELAKAREVMISDDGLMIAHSLKALEQIGLFLAKSFEVVPARFRNKPNDCAVAHQLCQTLGINTIASLPAIYLVHGTPSIDGKLAIAIMNTSDLIEGRVEFEMGCQSCRRTLEASETVCRECGTDDALRCTASAKDAHSGKLVSFTVDMDMVRGEKWDKNDVKDGVTYMSKWNTMRVLMFHYRSGSFLQRVHFPEILFGIQTKEEVEDVARREGKLIPSLLAPADLGGTSEADPLAGFTPTAQAPAATKEPATKEPEAGGTGSQSPPAVLKTQDTPPAAGPTESEVSQGQAATREPIDDEHRNDSQTSLLPSEEGDQQAADEDPTEEPAEPATGVLATVLEKLTNAGTAGGKKNVLRKAREGRYGDLSEADVVALDQAAAEQLGEV